MEDNDAAFPPPPFYWQQRRKAPPRPLIEGEFSMFGRVFTTKEMPLRIDTNIFTPLATEHSLQDAASYKRELYKLQFSLLNKSLELLKTLAENPMSAPQTHADYEQIILNFYQLILALRPKQALYWLKCRLADQIEEKAATTLQMKEALRATAAALEDCEEP